MLAEAFEALAEHVDGAKLEGMVRRILDQQFVAVQTPQDDTPARLTEAAPGLSDRPMRCAATAAWRRGVDGVAI